MSAMVPKGHEECHALMTAYAPLKEPDGGTRP